MKQRRHLIWAGKGEAALTEGKIWFSSGSVGSGTTQQSSIPSDNSLALPQQDLSGRML